MQCNPNFAGKPHRDQMLDDCSARAWVQREIAKLDSAQRKVVELDSDGIGYRAFDGAARAEWHNCLYGFGRHTYYQACLKRYPKGKVIRAFGSYRYGRVEGLAQALGRADRLELEWRAACGDPEAALKLGLITKSKSLEMQIKFRNKACRPALPFHGRGAFLISTQGLSPAQIVDEVQARMREDFRSS